MKRLTDGALSWVVIILTSNTDQGEITSLLIPSLDYFAQLSVLTISTSCSTWSVYIYVGDGDSSSFGEVADAMFKQFGEEYLVLKEDSVGHRQKRMGTNLRKYKTCRWLFSWWTWEAD